MMNSVRNSYFKFSKSLTERDTLETHLWPYWTCRNFVLTRSHLSSQPHFFRYDPSNSTYDSRRQIRWSYIEHCVNLRWETTSLCCGGMQPHFPMRKIAEFEMSQFKLKSIFTFAFEQTILFGISKSIVWLSYTYRIWFTKPSYIFYV